ncbi:MAG: sulfopyruvate decarboxylase subunit alpha [Candidatus Tectimicrobiota bacterium]
MKTSSTEPAVRDALYRHGIDLVLTVPCKALATLIREVENDERFFLMYPSREEEGVGIAAGAYLAGRKAVMLIQNSGLGNMVNACCSLNQYYGIPLCLIISHRGDESETVPAQVPMGVITPNLLTMLGTEWARLDTPADLPRLEKGLRQYSEHGESVAFLTKQAFWTT